MTTTNRPTLAESFRTWLRIGGQTSGRPATLAMTRFKLGMGATLAGCAGLGWAVRMATQTIM